MFIPHTYVTALLLMLFSMLCWGSWANTQKIDKRWRFELFYWDYTWGLLACALLFGLTLGNRNPASSDSFFRNLGAASARSLLEAFFGGVIFNVGNLLLVAAISVAGMAVAFPIGAGLALVIGAVINYVISPKGNPILLFGGIGLICIAIMLDPMAYRGLSGGAKATTKGIGLSLACGIAVGFFYPFVAKALTGPNHLGSYTVYFVFAFGAVVSNFPRQYGIDNPLGLSHYHKNGWGFTASDGPGPAVLMVNGVQRVFYDYVARGAPFGPDDGTIAPWAVVASLPFAPEIVIDTVHHAIERLGLKGHNPYGFDASFNPTFPASSKDRHGWVSPWIFGLNQGPIILMIENFQSELIWKLIRGCPYIVEGLRRAGFRAVGCHEPSD